jgi:hypothetical protein
MARKGKKVTKAVTKDRSKLLSRRAAVKATWKAVRSAFRGQRIADRGVLKAINAHNKARRILLTK